MAELTQREEWDSLSNGPLTAEASLALDAIARVLTDFEEDTYGLLLEGAKAYERHTSRADPSHELAKTGYAGSLAALLHAHDIMKFLNRQARSIATGQDPILTQVYASEQTRYLNETSDGE